MRSTVTELRVEGLWGQCSKGSMETLIPLGLIAASAGEMLIDLACPPEKKSNVDFIRHALSDCVELNLTCVVLSVAYVTIMYVWPCSSTVLYSSMLIFAM